jgi:hypothetical protein
MEKYEEWIKLNVLDDGYGKCADVTQRMAAAFPELKRIRGHYYCVVWGERTHWWLVAPDGTIVDPTKAQFPSKGTGVYAPWHEGDREPSGMCANCGELCYDGDTCCSAACHNAYAAFCCAAV